MYQILPFIEQDNLYRLSDISPTNPGSHVRPFPLGGPGAVFTRVDIGPRNNGGEGPLSNTAAVKTFFCPSRRPAQLYSGWRRHKGDYANAVPGPRVPLVATWNPQNTFWDEGRKLGLIARGLEGGDANGTATIKLAKTTFASVIDGTSNTMAIGEKFLQPQFYTGFQFSEDKGAFHGFDNGYSRSLDGE